MKKQKLSSKEIKYTALMDDLSRKMSAENRLGDFNRARSITVGTSFGGTTELSMRMNDGRTVWATLQPVEVIELIHQLSANVGCHLMLKPRDDFSSWRDWRVTPQDKQHLNGFPPFVNDMAPHNQVGANLPSPEQQPGLQPALMAKDGQNETVATEKPKHKRSTKRAATTT